MPNFTTLTSDYTVVDYIGRMARRELTINREYQRTDQVWPDAARSFLIESMLLGYPIPKLSIREITDLTTQTTTSEIVDGQQRSKAIEAFYQNRFPISKKSELAAARGCLYKDLDEDLQRRFISFRLSADVFVGATNEEIIELFRRINSYTMSLNPEEHRHATYQGEMKWFVYLLSKEYQPVLETFGALGVKQFARMQDTKLLADIIYAILHGIKTTKAAQLNALYKDNDKDFPEGASIKKRFENSIDVLRRLPNLKGTSLMKPYNFYALLLAIMHAIDSIPSLQDVVGGGDGLVSHEVAEANLLVLADTLERDDPPPEYEAFWNAASSKTNTEQTRKVRFATFYEALAVE